MTNLRVSLLQTSLFWEAIDQNLEMFTRKIRAIQEPTDLIVLPELFSTGFTMNNRPVAESMKGKAVSWMKQMAKEKNAVITGSLIIEEKKKIYNRLIWMTPSGKFKTYDKRHLFRYAGEQNHYSGGKKKLVVELKGWKICPLICYDLRFPAWIRNQVKSKKGSGRLEYDLLLFVANWPERRNHPWKTLLVARAMENQCYVAGVNRVGNDGNNIYHSGDTALINFKGEVISTLPAHEEKHETITISYADLVEWRKMFPAWMDADSFKIK